MGEKWTDQEVQDAVTGHLKGDDPNEAANETVNVPIHRQQHGLKLTVKARYGPTLLLLYRC